MRNAMRRTCCRPIRAPGFAGAWLLLALLLVSAGRAPAAEVIADSILDWSTTGTQGENDWYYGWYDFTADADGTYQADDFQEFLNDGSNVVVLGGNSWNGGAWALAPDPGTTNGPWTNLAQEFTHPNGTNSGGNEHWTVRRWIADRTGRVAIQWQMRDIPTGCDDGVTGYLFHNDIQLDTAAITGPDTVGVIRTVEADVVVGDTIDLALGPKGLTGGLMDWCDGSNNQLTISEGVPDTDGDGVNDLDDNCLTIANTNQADGDSDGIGDVCDNCPANSNADQADRDGDGVGNVCDSEIADSLADWSATGTQGEKSWFSGYYNYTQDPDQTYQDADFLDFFNDGSGGATPVSPEGNHWNGTMWDLLNNGAAGNVGPWTELGAEGTHPNGTNSAPGEEHWTIRRWVSDRSTNLAFRCHLRKTNTGAQAFEGVTGILFINGEEGGRWTIAGNDGTGVWGLVVQSVNAGDVVDFALTPENVDGTRGDGADGSAFRLIVDTKVPDDDEDGVGDNVDNCLGLANPGQENADGDTLGDACDNCPSVANDGQEDRNLDGSGDACEAPYIADSMGQWAADGVQGTEGWFNGYTNRTLDDDGVYQADDFQEFDPAMWTGAAFDMNTAAAAPWTFLGPFQTHPNGTNNGDEHWTVRRWVSDRSGTLALTWHLRKENQNPTGVTGLLFVNDDLLDQATIIGEDGAGVTRTVVVDVATGDTIDLALSPLGVCGDPADGSDGSLNYLTIRDVLPAGQAKGAYEILADSMADWSASGTQGEKGWYYGYHDFRTDVETGNGTYDAGDFIEFLNDGSNVVSTAGAAGAWADWPNHWNGGAWDLLNNGTAETQHGPWTELSCAQGHPAANSGIGTEVHWAMRRWVSTYAGEVEISGFVRNNTAGNLDGVVGRVFVNGTELGSRRSAGAAPAHWTVTAPVEVGDTIDLALDPDGGDRFATGGLAAITDGSDGSYILMTVRRIVPSGGPVGPKFIRGDANGDGEVNITDGIYVLNYLFLGGETPTCQDAADTNGDDGVNITDGIFVLNFLFLGGGEPPAPYPACGEDPGADETVDCAASHPGCI